MITTPYLFLMTLLLPFGCRFLEYKVFKDSLCNFYCA